jgi:hypothetical protein
MSTEYYVYAYMRDNNTPYYIGKGKNDRAWSPHVGCNMPKDKTKILMMETNLTEIGALALERRYIRWYGRKNINTGILRNLTDGGEGCSGMNHSDEVRMRISKTLKGKKHSEQHKLNIKLALTNNEKLRKPKSKRHKETLSLSLQGRKLSDEHRKNLSRKIFSDEHRRNLSRAKSGKNNPMYGKHRSDETKEKIAKAMSVIMKGNTRARKKGF